jgi:hypothetical protein
MGEARPDGQRPGLPATPRGVARWDGASGQKRLPIGQARQGPQVHEPYAKLLRPQLSNLQGASCTGPKGNRCTGGFFGRFPGGLGRRLARRTQSPLPGWFTARHMYLSQQEPDR